MTADSQDYSTETIISRYSGLARAALDGAPITDCDPDAFAASCYGATAYADTTNAPAAALHASLGCGNPVAVAALEPGEIVLDLGSGGGLDVLLSARRVGPDGIAYGLDASSDMLSLAEANAAAAGVLNARFLHGRIEAIPLPDEHVDVVISNCVINLSADKRRVLAEAFRVLLAGCRIGISDVVADEGIDPELRASAEQQVGCLAGTITQREYEQILAETGFTGISVTSSRQAGPGLSSAIIQAVKPPVPF